MSNTRSTWTAAWVTHAGRTPSGVQYASISSCVCRSVGAVDDEHRLAVEIVGVDHGDAGEPMPGGTAT